MSLSVRGRELKEKEVNNMMETYHGLVKTPADAIKLFEACRLGHLPRVQRRLSEKERQSIRSGSVFVWDEREAGMRRWTDGKSWSASRVSGSFLTYREMEGKRANGFGSKRNVGKTPESGRGSDEDQEDGEPDGYRYKADGLMKQSFSITTSVGQHLHLISYLSRPHHGDEELLQPTNDPNLRSLVPAKGMYPESSMNEQPLPAMTRSPMQPQPHPPVKPQYQPHAAPPQAPNGYMMPYHPGYEWAPSSPAGTGPYAQTSYPTAPYHLTQAPPPPQYNSQAYGPHSVHHQPPHYQTPPSQPLTTNYEQNALPPILGSRQSHMVSAAPSSQSHPPSLLQPHSSSTTSMLPSVSQSLAPRPRSPRSEQLRMQARAATTLPLDPRLSAIGANTAPGSLPRTTGSSYHRSAMATPSTCSPSALLTHEAVAATNGSKSSLSALLHTTPTSSEPSSSNSSGNSATSSPRTAPVALNGGLLPKRALGEDARAIGALNKQFCA